MLYIFTIPRVHLTWSPDLIFILILYSYLYKLYYKLILGSKYDTRFLIYSHKIKEVGFYQDIPISTFKPLVSHQDTLSKYHL